MPPAIRRSLIAIFLVAAIGLSAAGMVDRGADWLALGRLDDANNRYLDTSFDKALAGFLLLSGIKSGLAVIEGSEVGVGFNLEIGDVVQPLYDYVDIAWRAALAGGSIITVMRFGLESTNLIDHWALTLVLGIGLAGCLVRWLRPQSLRANAIFNQAVRFGAAVSLSLYLLLPLSVTAAAALSQQITRPLVEQTHQQLKQIGDAMTPSRLNDQFFQGSTTEGTSLFEIKDKVDRMSKGAKDLMRFLKLKTEQMAALTIKLIAAYLFDCIVFPLFFGLILMTLLKSGIGALFTVTPATGQQT